MAQFMWLREAVERHDKVEIRRMVQNGAVLNCRNSGGATILHTLPEVSMTEHLVNLGADINARDITQKTPLHYLLSTHFNEQTKNVVTRQFFEHAECAEHLNVIVNAEVEKMRMQQIDCFIKSGADVNARCYTQSTSLHRAIRLGNVEAVKVLARLGGADLTNKVEESMTPLILAVEAGDKEVIKLLVESGANVNAMMGYDVTVLNEAIRSGSLEIVKILLENGANTNEVILSGTPLLQALHQKDKEVMKLLVEYGADVNSVGQSVTELIEAIRSGNLEIVKALLEYGANAKEKTITSFTCVGNLLHRDDKHPDLDIFTCLADLGADFNLPAVSSNSLHEAVLLEKPDMLKCLLRSGTYMAESCIETALPIVDAINERFGLVEHLVQCGADITARFDVSTNVFTMVARTGNIEMVEALAGEYFDRNHTQNIRVSPLYFLRPSMWTYRDPQTFSERFTLPLKTLLHLGADPNIKQNNFTALHEAVARGDVNMVKALVNLGADVNETCIRGISFFQEYQRSMTALSKEYEEGLTIGLKCMVEEAGADVNSGCDQITPLFLAVEKSDTRMVETLCSLGADMNQTVSKGELKAMRAPDSTEIIEYLIEHGADPYSEQVRGIEPLLEAVSSCDTKMVQCLLKCGANPRIGGKYITENQIHCAVKGGNADTFKCLIKAGSHINNEVIYWYTNLTEEAKRVAERFRITSVGSVTTLLTDTFDRLDDSSLLQMLLSLGANRSKNIEFRVDLNCAPSLRTEAIRDRFFSNLHVACSFGDLDIARMLIMDGSDVNKCNSFGIPPFDSLSLAACVDYHTLHETRTTDKVVERVGQHLMPIISSQSMESLLDIPGLGDVKSMFYPNSAQISKDVQMYIHKIVENCTSFTNLVSCGSTAEGTKVGLPDEMDFLAVSSPPCNKELVNLQDAGHDYVNYIPPTKDLAWSGSHNFHVRFSIDLGSAAEELQNMSFQQGNLTFAQGTYDIIKDSNRKATSPFKIRWDGKNTEHHVYISIDVVPSIHINGWPNGGVQETWLLGLEELQKHGYYIVPKPPHVQSDLAKEYTQQGLSNLWKISFPHLETYHMQRLEKRIKDVYLLAKILRNPDVCRIMVTDEGSYPLNVGKYITSYMLKMIVFKNVEVFLRSDLSLGEMVCQVYEQVEEGLSKGFIPLFFMPKVSAVAGHKVNMPKSAKVAKIMKKFVHALYIRDCQQDPSEIDDVEEVIVYQRKPTSVYKCIEIETYDMAHLEKRIEDVYLLAKHLRNPDVCNIMVTKEGSYPKTVDNYITNYMLKKVIFKNVENFRHPDLSLGEMVCRVYDKLEEGLSKEFLILYSMPKGSDVTGPKLNIPECAKVAKNMKKFLHGQYLQYCEQDPSGIDDVDEVTVYQRKPTSVYKFIEIKAYDMAHLEKRIKDVYLLAKSLRKPDVCRIMITDKGSNPNNVNEYITSSMLRKVIFKNAEDFRRSDLSLGEMVCQVYDKLEEGLSNESLLVYSMPKASALDRHNMYMCARVAKLMKTLVRLMYSQDFQQDLSGIDDVKEVIVNQCKSTSVYKCIEIKTYDMAHLENRIKDVYLLAKRLRNPDVSHIMITDNGSKTIDEYITSYMLEQIIVQNVEDFRHPGLSLGEMVCRVYDKLEEGFSKDFLILYFMPKLNAVDGHKLEMCAWVAKVMKRFVHLLYPDCQQAPSEIDNRSEELPKERVSPGETPEETAQEKLDVCSECARVAKITNKPEFLHGVYLECQQRVGGEEVIISGLNAQRLLAEKTFM